MVDRKGHRSLIDDFDELKEDNYMTMRPGSSNFNKLAAGVFTNRKQAITILQNETARGDTSGANFLDREQSGYNS